MMNPPELVKDTMRALMTILGHDDAEANDWAFIKKQMANISTLLNRILSYNADDFEPKAYQVIDNYLRYNTQESVANKSMALNGLYLWLQSTHDYQTVGVEIRGEIIKVQKRLA